MQMPLFSEIKRTDPSRASPGEDSFSFLDRVDQKYWDRIRTELERWFADYPADETRDLRARFRKKDPTLHFAAWWELYLFRLFKCLDFDIEIHPELSDTTTRPDFRLRRNGESFLLEATTTFSGIVEKGRAGDREGWVLAAIEKAENRDFYVHLEFETVGKERPKDREIVAPLERWLGTLDPDEIGRSSLMEAPQLRLEIRDWVMVFRPLPVKPEARGKRPDKRMLGLGPSISGPVNDVEKIQAGLKRKARKYGHPTEPLMIAVLSLSQPEDEDIESALLGRIAWQFDPDNPGDGQWIRQEDGLWFRNGKPHATKISGVIVGVSLLPWMVAKRWPRAWLNPWASQPLSLQVPFPIRHANENGAVVSQEDASESPAAAFGLPDDWPGPEDRFA